MGDMKKLWVVASALAVFSVLAAVPASAQYEWASGLPGCDPSRPAVAHHAGGVPLVPQPTNGPVPCGVLTGKATIENRIEITNDNTVIYMPALLPGQPPQVPPGTTPDLVGGCGHVPGLCIGQTVSRSSDDGATWSTSTAVAFPDPTGQGFFAGDVDNRLYVDHSTGRLFYYDYDSGNVGVQPHVCGNNRGATIFFSDDSGATWSHGFSLDHTCTENPTILVGEPRISSPTGYPNVVYLCGNNFGTGIAGAGSTGKVCAKSLDGGLTWVGQFFENDALTAVPTTNPQGVYAGRYKDQFNPYPQCANGASSSAGNGVQPLPDGTLVIVVSCGGNTYLSESRDEGKTWQIRNKIPSGGELRADSQGNLYKFRESGSSVLLSTSSNGGVTWSAEKNMIAPGVVSIGSTDFAIGTHRVGHQVGRVAINYYGVRVGNTMSDGFITETRNALDPNPVFWSGQVNSPTRPLLYNTGTSNMGITVLDFTGSAFSPNGRSVWASFVQDCGTNILTDPNCTSRWVDGINPGNPQDAFAGRLVWP